MALLNGFGIETVVTKARAKELLSEALPPLPGETRKAVLDNLCIAPYSYVHTDAYTIKVNEMILEALKFEGLTNLLQRDSRGEWVMRVVTPAQYDVGNAVIKNVLNEIRVSLHRGEKLA